METVVSRPQNVILKELELSRKKTQILENAVHDLMEEMQFMRRQYQAGTDLQSQIFLGVLDDLADELRFTQKQAQSLDKNLSRAIDSVFDGESGNTLRETIVEVITLSLAHWEHTTGTTKIELAEQSRIWKVHLDKGCFRVRTFDRYLSSQTLPKKPRWRDVLRTARFVLTYSDAESPVVDQLQDRLQTLQTLIRDIRAD